ncbi:MAG TPA: hypothetical protein VNV42_15490 [Solirubrobacteraceae bacterium]|nr:hypothetical protein [Solirubrobacteraceae bacterium]
MLTVLVVLAALLGCMVQPGGAAAAIAPNPDPGVIARWEPCEPDTGVTEIVDEEHIGTGKIYVGCALGEPANGAETLQRAGFNVEGTKEYGLGFICRIEGEPTSSEQSCQLAAPANAYWSYWSGKPGGRWNYEPVGALSPQSKPVIGSIQGWSFSGDGGGAPRIEPMDGAGPHAFTLPAEQESSVVPAMLAREWLTGASLATVSAIEEHAATIGGGHVDGSRKVLERLLSQAQAVTQAGVSPSRLKPLVSLLAAGCEAHNVMIEGCELREIYDPTEVVATGVAAAVLGLQALGQDTESFAGLDPRGALEGMIEPDGEVQQRVGREPTEAVEVLAATVLALARSGTLSANALASIELLLAQQNANGQFGPEGIQTSTSGQVQVLEALVAAREKGEGELGKSLLERIEAALPTAGSYLEHIQGADGSVRSRENAEPIYAPTVVSTSQGALGLALAGSHAAAERAAKWVSSYQVTSEYAGHGDPEAGEHTPAETLIGAFTPNEGTLKEVLAYGEPTTVGGPAAEAQEATWPALLALTQAGPYGPYFASFDQESLFFESRPLGSPSKLTATLTNRDLRPVTITTVSVSSQEPADFSIAGGNCAGRTLAPRETCEAQVDFDPATLGLHAAQLQASLAGTNQTIQIPLDGTGTPAPEPQPPPKTEPKTASSLGPAVSPPSLTTAPGPSMSGPVGGLAVESISRARLLLKLTAPGVVTVKIARLLGKGHHRRWRTVKTTSVKTSKIGTLDVKLPRLATGSYRVSISLAGAKTVVKTLTVPRGRQ